MVIKTRKKRKSKKQRGNTTYGHGARKKWKGKGHKGGVGMAGSGKRADQKITLITKLYGNRYFGKKGITSRSTKKKRIKVVNLGYIQDNLNSFIERFGKGNLSKKANSNLLFRSSSPNPNKSEGFGDELDLSEYKILGDGELKTKLTIKARGFTNSAKEKIEKSGGKIIIAGKIQEKNE